MIIAFDTETECFRPGLRSPPIVCVQWSIDGGPAHLMTGRGEFANACGTLSPPSPHTFSSLLRHWLNDPGTLLVGHNVAYDLACFAAHDPTLLGPIFLAYRQNRVTDTMLRQKLADIGRGRYRGFFNGPVWIPCQYNLGDVGGRHGFRVDKDDPWRLRYAELRDVPLAEWPEGAISYALNDPKATWHAYAGQASRYPAELLVDEFNQARKFWGLHLAEVWGLRTSLRGVMSLEKGARERLEQLEELLKDPAGCGHSPLKAHAENCSLCRATPPLVKPDGVRDTKAAKARMRLVWEQAQRDGKPFELRATKSGDVCLDSDACNGSGDPLLEAYAELSSFKKVLANDVEALKLGVVHPIHTHFDIAETGRTTSAKPNVQNPRRLAGVRECYVPRGYKG